jgi:RNA polymerase-binding transcription factor DksA
MRKRKCNDCNEEISNARLEARPNATLCRDCQEIAEHNWPAWYKPPVRATAMAVLSEDDDSTRIIEEGWHQERLIV